MVSHTMKYYEDSFYPFKSAVNIFVSEILTAVKEDRGLLQKYDNLHFSIKSRTKIAKTSPHSIIKGIKNTIKTVDDSIDKNSFLLYVESLRN